MGLFFLPLFHPLAWLLSLPLLENSLSSDPTLYEWAIHYRFGPAMVTLVSLFFGLDWLHRSLAQRQNHSLAQGTARFQVLVPSLIFFLAGSVTLWSSAHSALPWSRIFPEREFQVFHAMPDTASILRSRLPMDRSVAAPSNLLPHLTHIHSLYLLPPGKPMDCHGATDQGANGQGAINCVPTCGWPDLIVYDTAIPAGPGWYNLWFYTPEQILAWVKGLEESNRYRPLFTEGSLHVLERIGG